MTILSKREKLIKATKYSVKKYKKTYKLLEKYDSGTRKVPKMFIGGGRLRDYFQHL